MKKTLEPLDFKTISRDVKAMQVTTIDAMHTIVAWVTDAGGDAWVNPRKDLRSGEDVPGVQVRCPDGSRRNAGLGDWVVFGLTGGGWLIYGDEFFTANFDSVM